MTNGKHIVAEWRKTCTDPMADAALANAIDAAIAHVTDIVTPEVLFATANDASHEEMIQADARLESFMKPLTEFIHATFHPRHTLLEQSQLYAGYSMALAQIELVLARKNKP